MNRKLIRTTLAEVKGRNDSPAPHREQRPASSGAGAPSRTPPPSGSRGADSPRPPGSSSSSPGPSSGPPPGVPLGRKRIPPAETNAEIFYYKKQMDAHTLMVFVLQDGEEVEGTIEWYDRNALKVNRQDEPNIMLLKHNIKYMYKAEDRGEDDEDDDE